MNASQPRKPQGSPASTGGEFDRKTGSPPQSQLTKAADPLERFGDMLATELQFVGGGSDKFYRVERDGSKVTITYGRNGTPGTSTDQTFGDDAAAYAFAQKKLKEKLTKGYKAVDDPTGSSSDRAISDDIGVDQSVLPMLAKPATADDVRRMLDDDRYVIEPKLDGDRVIVALRGGKRAAFNRQGQPKVKNVSAAHLAAFDGLEGDWTFDGEVVGRTFHVFDLPSAPGLHSESPFGVRRKLLEDTIAGLDCDPDAVRIIESVRGRDAKREFRQAAQSDRREGVIFRHVGGTYDPGRRTGDLMKEKFWKSADVVVTGVHPEKDSVEVSVRGADGKMRVVGNLTTIGKGPVREGDVVEAKFLYVNDAQNPTLFQPELMRVRHDKSAAECDLDQFVGTDTNREMS